ncbi:MFS transporter [Kordiimonas sp.]|uniref:MFS transporter n=1 Tax=Kordiimonas sp. TaxID=1970157 RepID=UPI003A8D078B
MTTTAIPQKASRREWIGLAVLALPCMLYSMDLTVLNLAVPHLSADLKPTSAELLWIVDIYGFILAGALIPMGTLGDKIGRRKLLLAGATAFGLASILAAFSSTVEMLIISRALLGLAAATLAPSTLSLIRNMFHDPVERTTAIGVWIASFSAGGALGPVLGGILLEFFHWGSVFLINVPVMLLLLAIAPKLLPEFKDPNAGKPDVLSGLLSVIMVLGVIFGIKRFAEFDFSAVPFFTIALGLLVGALFVRRQRKLKEPFIDLALLKNRSFTAGLAVNLFSIFTCFASFLLFAQYLQLVLGLSPLMAGLWSAPTGLVFVIGSMLTPKLLRAISPSRIISGGLTLAAIGFAAIAVMIDGHNLPLFVFAYTLMCMGFAPVFTLTTDMIMTAAPPERAGAASGIAETATEFGGALGIAVLGSLVTAIYRSRLIDLQVPGVPADVAEAARDTLGGAIAAANTLPDAQAAALELTTRAAYVDAYQAAAIVCAFVVVFVVALTTRRLRGLDAKMQATEVAEAS